MDIQKYENLKTIEQVKIYSQTESGYIYICSKENWQTPIFKWNNVYVHIPKKMPTQQELKQYIIGSISTKELNQLYKFLSSKNKYGFIDFTVFQTCQIAWVGFHPGTDF